MLSEVLLDNNQLNDQFIEMVENIHMKQRIMGLSFVLKSREAKDRRIESHFKSALNELLGDASHYGSEIVLRKLIMSQIALGLPQNLGIDYHASTEELYYYMRKKDRETHTELMSTIKSIIDKTKVEDNLRAIPRHSTILAKFVSKRHISLCDRSAKYFTALALFDPHTCY